MKKIRKFMFLKVQQIYFIDFEFLKISLKLFIAIFKNYFPDVRKRLITQNFKVHLLKNQ